MSSKQSDTDGRQNTIRSLAASMHGRRSSGRVGIDPDDRPERQQQPEPTTTDPTFAAGVGGSRRSTGDSFRSRPPSISDSTSIRGSSFMNHKIPKRPSLLGGFTNSNSNPNSISSISNAPHRSSGLGNGAGDGGPGDGDVRAFEGSGAPLPGIPARANLVRQRVASGTSQRSWGGGALIPHNSRISLQTARGTKEYFVVSARASIKSHSVTEVARRNSVFRTPSMAEMSMESGTPSLSSVIIPMRQPDLPADSEAESETSPPQSGHECLSHVIMDQFKSIRVWLTILVTMLLVFSNMVILLLVTTGGNNAVADHIAESIMKQESDNMAARARDMISFFVDTHYRTKSKVDAGIVSFDDPDTFTKYVLAILRVNNRYSAIYLTYTDGSLFGAAYTLTGDHTCIIKTVTDSNNQSRILELIADDTGDPVEPLIAVANVTRSWNLGQLPWVTPLNLSNPNDVQWVPLYSRVVPVFSRSAVMYQNGTFRGVLTVEINNGQLASILRQFAGDRDVSILAIDLNKELLVATSYMAPPLVVTCNTSAATSCSYSLPLVANVTDEFVVAATQAAKDAYGGWKNLVSDTLGATLPDGRLFYIRYSVIEDGKNLRWALIQIGARKTLISELLELQLSAVAIDVVFIAGAALTAYLCATNLFRPVEYITEGMQNFIAHVASEKHGITAKVDEATLIKNEMLEERASLREISELQDAYQTMKRTVLTFTKYVPVLIVDRIIAGEPLSADLYFERRQLTIFFSDLKNFTTLAESLEPTTLIQLLSEYLNTCTTIINTHQGFVGDFIGDAIMAFHGAPDDVEEHAVKACNSALKQQEALVKLNRRWSVKHLPELTARMGIHTGDALAGNIGSRMRVKYGVVGDNVNIASSLEGLNKRYKTGIIITRDTSAELEDQFEVRPLELILIKSREAPLELYELVGWRGQVPQSRLKQCREFTSLYEASRNGFATADEKRAIIVRLKAHIEVYPDDQAAVLLLERAETGRFEPTQLA